MRHPRRVRLVAIAVIAVWRRRPRVGSVALQLVRDPTAARGASSSSPSSARRPTASLSRPRMTPPSARWSPPSSTSTAGDRTPLRARRRARRLHGARARQPSAGDSPAELWLLDVLTKTSNDARRRRRPAHRADPRPRRASPLVYRVHRARARQAADACRPREGVRRALVHDVRDGVRRLPGRLRCRRRAALTPASPSTRHGTSSARPRAERPVHCSASCQIARDWRISPDGSALVVPRAGAAGRALSCIALQVIRLADGPRAPMRAGERRARAAEQFGPVWTPDGGALTVGREACAERPRGRAHARRRGGGVTARAAPARGFDLPLGWSPDGRCARARARSTVTSCRASPDESIVADSTDGTRRSAVTADGELIFLGWVDAVVSRRARAASPRSSPSRSPRRALAASRVPRSARPAPSCAPRGLRGRAVARCRTSRPIGYAPPRRSSSRATRSSACPPIEAGARAIVPRAPPACRNAAALDRLDRVQPHDGLSAPCRSSRPAPHSCPSTAATASCR